ncbi:hypothetical protein AU476_03755 [Cupriavidus sp. UYMSc13B]|nr:hypothetical protein AU476_03755 [Cupriavidus sp. UYMSc13B]
MKNCHSQSSAQSAAHGNSWGFLRFPWLVLLAGLAIAAMALASLHWSQVASWLPFALVLLCPLMHFFHSGHHGHSTSPDKSSEVADNGTTSREAFDE